MSWDSLFHVFEGPFCPFSLFSSPEVRIYVRGLISKTSYGVHNGDALYQQFFLLFQFNHWQRFCSANMKGFNMGGLEHEPCSLMIFCHLYCLLLLVSIIFIELLKSLAGSMFPRSRALRLWLDLMVKLLQFHFDFKWQNVSIPYLGVQLIGMFETLYHANNLSFLQHLEKKVHVKPSILYLLQRRDFFVTQDGQ